MSSITIHLDLQLISDTVNTPSPQPRAVLPTHAPFPTGPIRGTRTTRGSDPASLEMDGREKKRQEAPKQAGFLS